CLPHVEEVDVSPAPEHHRSGVRHAHGVSHDGIRVRLCPAAVLETAARTATSFLTIPSAHRRASVVPAAHSIRTGFRKSTARHPNEARTSSEGRSKTWQTSAVSAARYRVVNAAGLREGST